MYEGSYGEQKCCTGMHEFPFTLFEVKYLCEVGCLLFLILQKECSRKIIFIK